MQRKIIHIDMDAFYASVEQRDNPELRGKPVAVGGGGRRGVVAAASYEARAYGVHSAMPGFKAAKACPQIIFVKPRFPVYKEVSRHIREIFHDYTDLVEPLSLDEAYLDVTDNKKGIASAARIAAEIRAHIQEQTGLTASAGVSFNEFLGKTASDIKKPDGLTVISPHEAEAFLEHLPVERFHGIGKVTARKMHRMGIRTGEDLKAHRLEDLLRWFGKAGRHYYHIVRGEDDRPVNPNRLRKSIGAEQTFSEDLTDPALLRAKLEPLCKKVFGVMQQQNNYGRTLTLKFKSTNFQTHTRSKTYQSDFTRLPDLLLAATDLLEHHYAEVVPVRLIGISVSTLQREHPGSGIQLELDFE